MKRAVLLDFHNTLATCDGWLDLEISSLPAKVLERLDGGSGDAALVEATERFRALRERVKASGHELSALEGTMAVFSEMRLAVSEGEASRIVVGLEHEALEELEPVEGALLALERLRDAGCRLGVVSSAGYPPFVELALERLGMRSLFSAVLTSAGEGIYKSNPEIYRRAVSRLGTTPEMAVHVGDHPVFDVQTAHRAGLSAIWFAGHSERTARIRGVPWSPEESEGKEAEAVIYEMAELFDAVAGLPPR